MGGQPWRRLLLVIVVFSLLGYPVWKLTTKAPERLSPVAVGSGSDRNLSVKVCFAAVPQEFSLSYLDKVVLEGDERNLEYSGELKVVVPREGIDLLLKVRWPPQTPRTAVEVRVSDHEQVLADKTAWSAGDLVAIVTVPGSTSRP